MLNEQPGIKTWATGDLRTKVPQTNQKHSAQTLAQHTLAKESKKHI
jgi:hypothetical protein